MREQEPFTEVKLCRDLLWRTSGSPDELVKTDKNERRR